MRKFTKILTLVLALVAIVAAFTVVSLAAETDTRPTPKSFMNTSTGGSWDTTFENTTLGSARAFATTKKGMGYHAATLDGNKYLSFKYANGNASSNNANLFDLHATYSRASYSLDTHSMMSFDFDVMTEDGKWGDTSSNTTYFYFFVYKSSDAGPSLNSIYFSELGLSSTPYEWQHVTIVYEYDNSSYKEGDTTMPGVFKLTAYVNGVETYSRTDDISTASKWTAYGTNLANVHLGCMRIQPVRFSGGTYDCSIGMDNLRFNYFPTLPNDSNAKDYSDNYYSADEAGTYVYNSNYKLPANSPEAAATVTNSKGKVLGAYATAEEAIAAANDGETVTLFKNVQSTVVVNKAITVKTAITYTNSNGSVFTVKAFNFNYVTQDGYVATPNEADSTLLNFAKSDNVYTVNWDPVCEGECTCPGAVKHLLTYTTTVANGSAPVCPVSTEIGFKDGCLVTFLGWTNVKGGTEVVDLATITSNVAGDVINLYPVYDITRYDIEVIKNGKSSGYFAADYLTAIAAVAKGGTFKLHADLRVDNVYKFSNADANIVIDLNGYNFTRFTTYNNHYNATYDEESGTWVKGSRMKDAEGKNVNSGVDGAAFTIAASGVNITVKNSAENKNANIYLYTQFRDTWYDADGNLVGYDSVRSTNTVTGNQNSGTILFGFTGAKNTVINILGNGITFYGASLVLNEWGGNQDTNSVYVDGGTYYAVVNTYVAMIAQLSGGTVDVRNATFVTNGHSAVIRVAEKVNTSSVTKVDFKFTNCDIIGGATQNANPIGAAGIVVENCRYYASGESNNDLTLGRGTYANDRSHSVALIDGMQRVSYTYPKTYTLMEEKTYTYGDDGYPTCEFTPVEKIYEFKYYVADPELDLTTVNWYTEDGSLIKTTQAIKNFKAAAPYYVVASGDSWRGYKVTEWLDANGSVSDLMLGDASEYSFTAKVSASSENYVAYITDAWYNFVYYAQFHTVLYLPVTDNVEITSVDGGFTSDVSKVKIGGVEYWAFTRYESTTDVSDDKNAVVNFTCDGVNYTQTFTLSALRYAEIILTAPENDIEKTAVANMVRYIKEARLAKELEVSEKFDQLISLGNLSDLGAQADYVDTTVDYSTLKDYVSSVKFRVFGSSASYVIDLKDAAIGATISVTYLNSGDSVEIRNADTTNAVYTINTRVYDLTKAIKITVTVPATEEGAEPTVISGTYSAKAYINATDDTLTKAVYEFGVAAKAYREYLEQK